MILPVSFSTYFGHPFWISPAWNFGGKVFSSKYGRDFRTSFWLAFTLKEKHCGFACTVCFKLNQNFQSSTTSHADFYQQKCQLSDMDPFLRSGQEGRQARALFQVRKAHSIQMRCSLSHWPDCLKAMHVAAAMEYGIAVLNSMPSQPVTSA